MRAFSRSKAVFSVTIVSVVILCGCSKKPQAWYPTPPYPAATGKDFDLTSSKTDLNGSPDDPEWATQLQSSTSYPPVKDSACQKSNQQPYDSQCTDQSQHLVQDRGTGLTGLACELFGDPSSINGHVDWTVASAHGSVGFLNFADDWDYNLFLVPFGDAGLTQDNNFVTGTQQRYIEIEFDSRELADRFSTQWWQEFARLATQGAQKGDFTQVENHLHAGNGLALGVVYGLFGLDCEHGCRSEYHPAYAVAIQLNGAPDKNTWAIFARNWGDEGFCSHLDHQFDLGNQVMKLLLPFNSANPPTAVTIQEAASSEIDPAASNPQTQNEWCPTFSFSPNQGEVIGIPLPSASEQALTEVVVQFAWPDGTSPLPSINIEPSTVLNMLQSRAQPSAAIPPDESAEEHLGRLFQAFHGNAMTGQQFSPMVLHQYLTRTPSAAQTSRQVGIYSRKNILINCSTPITTGLTPGHPRAAVKAAKTKARRQTDEAKAAWDKATISEICTEYEKAGRKLPPGEPANTAQKLETLCADKRLKQ